VHEPCLRGIPLHLYAFIAATILKIDFNAQKIGALGRASVTVFS
jgi:hypothetical protein